MSALFRTTPRLFYQTKYIFSIDFFEFGKYNNSVVRDTDLLFQINN